MNLNEIIVNGIVNNKKSVDKNTIISLTVKCGYKENTKRYSIDAVFVMGSSEHAFKNYNEGDKLLVIGQLDCTSSAPVIHVKRSMKVTEE